MYYGTEKRERGLHSSVEELIVIMQNASTKEQHQIIPRGLVNSYTSKLSLGLRESSKASLESSLGRYANGTLQKVT